MAKIYYSVDTKTHGFPICWLDELGRKRLNSFPGVDDPGQACGEFEKSHPGAVFLSWGDLLKRIDKVEDERHKLAAWKEWVR